MIYEVQLRNPYRILMVEADTIYSGESAVRFVSGEDVMHIFPMSEVHSVTVPHLVRSAERVASTTYEAGRLPLTRDSNFVADNQAAINHAPSVLRASGGSDYPEPLRYIPGPPQPATYYGGGTRLYTEDDALNHVGPTSFENTVTSQRPAGHTLSEIAEEEGTTMATWERDTTRSLQYGEEL